MLPAASAAALREVLTIVARGATPEHCAALARNVEQFIQRGAWPPAFMLDDLPGLFYPHDARRAFALRKLIKSEVVGGRLRPIAPGRVTRSDLAAWPNCPRIPADSPLRFWMPEKAATDAPDRPTGARKETAEERQARRLQACRGAGLRFSRGDPNAHGFALPKGIGAIASREGVSRQAFTKDLRAALRREYLEQVGSPFASPR